MNFNQHQQQLVGVVQPISAPTKKDVLQGRGQGVQRHPGNVKYRTLVFVNKGLYAKCPRTDKIKISKGIVAAIREVGGRFLELDERSGTYRDIGDKKATEKTSQALREGQKEIRQELYKTNEMYNVREMSAEGYFGYSVQVLESLHNSEDQNNPEASASPQASRAAALQPPIPAVAVAGDMMNAPPLANPAMLAALDQFPGAAPTHATNQQQVGSGGDQMPSLPLPPLSQAANQAQADLTAQIGRFTDTSMRITDMGGRQSSMRFTNMSMGSMLSNYSLSELAALAKTDDRNSEVQSVMTQEIRDLIRLSAPQLMQVDSNNGNRDSTANMAMAMETEVVVPKENEDRVSELRMTDVGTSPPGGATAANPRQTFSSQSTNYSKTSLMDASMMTIQTEDMSIHSGPLSSGGSEGNDAKRQKVQQSGDERNSSDLSNANLLLNVADQKKKDAEAQV